LRSSWRCACDGRHFAMIIGTAGHIDHGKTTLVRALTGVDTDRLQEEKARGISIELGYAYTPLATGEVLGFVDVPGHERLVHTMVAGACGIDFALLTVAADDGVMPQTLEHLAIIELLGVSAGAVALTKIDRVTVARAQEAEAQVRAALSATPLAALSSFQSMPPTPLARALPRCGSTCTSSRHEPRCVRTRGCSASPWTASLRWPVTVRSRRARCSRDECAAVTPWR